jgi:indolepyruvate ferredoxin oxidoreductase, beta subunit
LPMPRAAFEEAIKRGGVGIEASLRAFAAGYESATAPTAAETISRLERGPRPDTGEIPEWVNKRFPSAVRDVVLNGARRCADYQDVDYARTYLTRLMPLLAYETASNDTRLTREAARYLALWMSFEDTIRVADLKIRSERFARFRAEVRAEADQIVYVAEFVHPRFQEVCDTLPAPLGRVLLRSQVWRRLLEPAFKSGRHLQTAKVSGFCVFFVLSRLKRWRRSTLRFSLENAAIEKWLAEVIRVAADSYEFAFELAQCPRLIKGYGDTHERGMRNFQAIMAELPNIESRADAPQLLAQLRDAALKDDSGRALANAIEELGKTDGRGNEVSLVEEA